MNNRSYALMTGLFILLLGAGVLGAFYWLGGSREPTQPYIVVTQGSVYGLMPQSTVYYRGISVGKVRNIHFDPKDPGQILITVDINAKVPIMQSAFGTLKLQGVTGLSQLELENGSGQGHQVLPTSEASPARIPMHPSLFDEISDRGSKLMDQLDQIIGGLNHVLDPKGQAHIRHIIAQADTATGEWVALTRELRQGAQGITGLTQGAQRTLTKADRLIASLNDASAQLRKAARDAGRLVDRADTLIESGQVAGQHVVTQTLPNVDDTLHELQQTAKALNQLATSLKDNPQQLLSGPTRPAPGPGEPGYQESP